MLWGQSSNFCFVSNLLRLDLYFICFECFEPQCFFYQSCSYKKDCIWKCLFWWSFLPWSIFQKVSFVFAVFVLMNLSKWKKKGIRMFFLQGLGHFSALFYHQILRGVKKFRRNFEALKKNSRTVTGSKNKILS